MQPVTPAAARYDDRTILLHWLTAVLVVAQWLGAQVIDWFPRGAPRVDARSVHILFGTLLALVLAARVAWRLTGGRRLASAEHGALHVLAKATHYGLYALVAGTVALGLFNVWARGDSIFNLFSLPQYDPADPGLGHRVTELHGTLATAILYLAGFHAAAALVHRYLWHDGTLARMLPGSGFHEQIHPVAVKRDRDLL